MSRPRDWQITIGMDILLVNPKAGALRKSDEGGEELLARLRSRGIDASLVCCEDDGLPDAEIARAGRLIVAGGDGTVHSVLRSVSTCGGLSIAIIPLGTANHLADALGIPEDIDSAIDLIAAGHSRRIDLGLANGTVFSQAAGVGLHARMFHIYGDRDEKSALDAASAAVTAVSDWHPRLMSLTIDGVRYTEVITQVTAANTPSYGRSFTIAPDALVDDGLLDIIALGDLGKAEIVQYAIAAVRGQLSGLPKVYTTRARRVEIATLDGEPVEVHADALPAGHTPAVIEVLPGCLEVVVPPEVD